MKFIDNEGVTDPRINLAIEEYALRHLPIDDTYLLFYVNEPSIIVGKNQNTIEEINKEYVEKNHIHVVRRLSGGGAVYHDLGNLNFSFLTRDDGKSFSNFQKFTSPVINALQKLGVNAQLSGRNDIQVGEKKISGNAQYTTKGRMFSHGTLLLDSEIEKVVDALKVNAEKIRSKGIKSIRSRVANINEFLEDKLTVDELKKVLLDDIFAGGDVETYKLTENDWKGINQISNERYGNWDWNYGKSPKFDLHRSKRFEGGTIDVRLNVSKGEITDCKIFGDFFGVGEVSDVEELLIGVKYEKNALHEALADVDMSYYFGKAPREGLIELIY
ncbi:lipoate--protein ligase [Salipaludibacillus agaradhaerens]|jgi:lipoate-protein ligase A|uniref:lipoate--protein ligase n=1 Tax=Salipaludibacillus agaradhaerens TaxID=76935 RepID=A0A9Q4B269_SALAG|nr:lipoate--protein ligase [Salipaludibacillus agaradhaerens]MCR6096836.1 lipoate--protein ligase [Salipaludibacillus agaradhaerens]MCR6113605.1 lipoate--protein ligase [Salipaludibacillus agaradhaerens]